MKTKTSQMMRLKVSRSTNKSKYQKKKSKAQKISLGKTKTNMFTYKEKASRYYRVNCKTASKKRKIILTSNTTSGNVKARIYKKGSKTCKKTIKLAQVDGYASYRLKKGKGTYYIKISKTDTKMSGKYTVKFK